MAFGEMWMELAKLRAEDLRDERRRVGCSRRAQVAAGHKPVAPTPRAGQLVHWLQQGQIGRAIELADAPITARGGCA